MIVAKHITPDKRMVLAICDSGLIGKKIEEGKRQLDLTSQFYKGKEMDKADALDLVARAYMVNCVGEESVGIALDAKLCSEELIMRVRNVPHCQAVVVKE